MSINHLSNQQSRQLGVTLVELIVFIVIVSVAIVGVLKVLNVTNTNSVNPMLTKQALSIAESLLVEIEQQAFTICDPDDPNGQTAITSAGCSAGMSQDNSGGTLGPATGESRYNNTNAFDNVADYNGLTMPDANCTGICNPGGNGTGLVIDPELQGYAASVAITRIGGTGNFAAFAAEEVLRVDVTVTGPANTTVRISGYKVRYAPNI
jgi:MSHA pilin protein MshD